MKPFNVYIETGEKKTFASAFDWPGWSRAGRDEPFALQALVDFGQRYADTLRSTGLKFHPPRESADLVVGTRMEGNTTTDFGAPAIIPDSDFIPLDSKDYDRFQRILGASWQVFDDAVQRAAGQDLQKGPRGGGRELEAILAHLLESDQGYLSRQARKFKADPESSVQENIAQMREAILDALEGGMRGEIPETGPRGGKLWPPRYFARRLTWHVLDHAWEIEDRIP